MNLDKEDRLVQETLERFHRYETMPRHLRADALYLFMVLQTRRREQAALAELQAAEIHSLQRALQYAVDFMRDQGYDFAPAEEVADDGPGVVVLHNFARGEPMHGKLAFPLDDDYPPDEDLIDDHVDPKVVAERWKREARAHLDVDVSTAPDDQPYAK